MATHDYDLANQSGAAFRGDANNALAAIVSQNSGSSAPSPTFAYMLWADTTNGLMKQRNAANSAWLVRFTLAETFVLSRSSNTILGVADFGRTIIATAGFTQTYTAVATLGDEWWVVFKNNSSSDVTHDPNSTEQIDGATTLILAPGESMLVYCNGSAFFTVGLTKVNSLTEDTSPDLANDFLRSWDASAGSHKKVKPQTVAAGPGATQAEMETGSATNRSVTPGVQQHHKSAAKAWVVFNGTGAVAITSAYNVGSITDNGTGDYTVNFSTAFSSTSYVGVVSGGSDAGPAGATVAIGPTAGAHTASAWRFVTTGSTFVATDWPWLSVVFFGDQ